MIGRVVGLFRGITMLVTRMVGWMYWLKAGLINLLYCLIIFSMFRFRLLMFRRSRRTRRMLEFVFIKIFMFRSWVGRVRY